MMAIQHRAPPRGLIHHSDRSAQYACGPHRKILDRHGIKASMSRKGDCLDNAPMESFFSSMKTELVHRTQFRTQREAKGASFFFIRGKCIGEHFSVRQHDTSRLSRYTYA